MEQLKSTDSRPAVRTGMKRVIRMAATCIVGLLGVSHIAAGQNTTFFYTKDIKNPCMTALPGNEFGMAATQFSGPGNANFFYKHSDAVGNALGEIAYYDPLSPDERAVAATSYPAHHSTVITALTRNYGGIADGIKIVEVNSVGKMFPGGRWAY